MKIIVNPHDIAIEKKEKVNENEYKITKCEFEFSEEYTNDLVKVAIFSNSAGAYKEYIINNECDIPAEVLEVQEATLLGVYSYKEENEELKLRYSPEPIKFFINKGSYVKDATNSEPITPTDKEQIEQMLANINIEANKVGRITTITYTNKDGITHEVTLEDGKSIEYNWQGTELGIRQEGESTYQYVDLKGDKGEAGAIKMQIVAELPETGQDDTIYLVPLEHPDIQGNNYAEYVWINGQWELLGKIGVQVDLTDYVKNTDYATASKGGVIKSGYYGLQVDSTNGKAYCDVYTYANYGNIDNQRFISKGTLENVITGKKLETENNKVTSLSSASTDTQYPSAKCMYDIIGNLETILTTLDIGGGAE